MRSTFCQTLTDFFGNEMLYWFSGARSCTPYFIIIVMMPDGFLWPKKSQLTLIFVTITQSLFVPVASLSGSALSRGTRTGQGLSRNPPGWPCKCVELPAENPRHEIKTLAVKSNKLIFSGLWAGSGSGARKMRFDFVNLLTRYMILCFSMTNFFKFGTYFRFEKL